MPIQIDVFDFKCFNQLRNGEAFDRNLSEFTPNLVGNIGETVKVEYLVNISQSANTEGVDEWEIQNDAAVKEIRRNSGSFLEDGIQIGDVYEFYADWAARKNTGATAEYTGTVEFISSDGLVIRYSVTSGTDSSNGVVTNVGLAFDQFTTPSRNTALFVKFGLISNDETFNFISKTTESEQVYYAGGLQPPNTVQAESLGIIKDWVSGEMNVEFSNTIPDFKAARYIVTHEFVLNPFYILAYREFVENGTVPDLLAGENSVKYAAELEFRKTLTDTGSSKIQQFDGLGGFVGWYGENFNGLNADYRIVSVSYEEAVSGDPLDAININTTTKAIVTVENVNGAITDYSCAAYLFRVPDSEDDYIATTTDLLENFLFKSDIVSSPDTSSPNIATSLVGGNLVIEYTVDYTVAEKLQLTTDDEFILLVQVEDPTVAVGNSDRIMLLADFKNYVDVDFISEFIDIDTYAFLQHGENLTDDNGATSPIVSNEDGILLDAVIGSNTNRNVIINGISVVLLAYNESENKSFALDNYVFNIGELVVSGGVQQIEVDTLRGYPLPTDDEFNLAKVSTGVQVGDFRQYAIQLGQKIKWQDWIFNPGVDNVFFDSSQPNNNLNEKSSNYSDEQNYQVKLALVVNVSGVDDLGRTLTGDFIHYGGNITVNDYDESEDGVSGAIETFDLETGNSLQGGVLYNGKDTLFRAVFQNAAAMLYGIHRIEPSQNQGDGILELSSLFLPDPNNLLKPLDGFTQLKFQLVGSVLTTECLIDGSLIQEGLTYKLSARVGTIPLDEYEFQTDKLPSGGGGLAFDPAVEYSGGDTPFWVFENGYVFQGLSINDEDGVLTGLDGTVQTVKILVVDRTLITGFLSQQDGITGGNIDFTPLEGLNRLSLVNQSNITGVDLPNNTYQTIDVSQNDLTSLDLSNIDFTTDANLRFRSNPNLVNPTYRSGDYSGSMVQIYGASCNLSGTLPLNKFTSANNCDIWFDNNINLTGVNFGVNLTTVREIEIEDCNLLAVDLSQVEFVNNARILFTDNFNLTSFTQPASGHAGSIAAIFLGRNGLNGNLDLSTVNFAENFVTVLNQTSPATGNLTSVTWPSSFAFPTNCGALRFQETNISSLDISWANFNVRSRLSLQNVPLNTLLLPPSMSATFSSIDITGTNLVTIDLSWVVMDANQNASGDAGSFNLNSNTNLVNITLPSTTSVPYEAIRMQNNDWNYVAGQLDIAGIYDINDQQTTLQSNNWTQTEVDNALVDIDNSASGGFTGRSINIAGTNAAPGASGLVAVASLQAKGFTVTTS